MTNGRIVEELNEQLTKWKKERANIEDVIASFEERIAKLQEECATL